METTTELKEEVVPLKSRIWVSGADGFVYLLQNIIAGGALTYYFTEIRGLDAFLAAIVWLLFGIWNAINDPLFGWISDRTKSGLGRRRPYIRYLAPFFGLCFILSWVNWPGSNLDQVAMFLQLLFLLFFFDILYTAIATSLYIMPFEMAVSNKARSSIIIWKILFSAIGMIIPLIVVPLILPGPGEDTSFFFMVMIIFGVFVAIFVVVSTYFYEEKNYVKEEEQISFFKAFKATFKNKSFLVYEIVSFSIIFVQTALFMGVIYYFKEFEISMLYTFLMLFIGIIIGLVLFVMKQESWGVKKSMTTMLCIFSFSCFLILFGGRFLIPVMIGFLGLGIGFSGGMFLIPLMNGDVIDKDEEMTGLRREGMYAGVNSFITKPAISLAQAAFLIIIAMFGYIQGKPEGTQSPMAETGIIVAWMLIPALLLLICFISMKMYPLAGPEWNETKARLAEIHKQKEKEYLEKHGIKYVE